MMLHAALPFKLSKYFSHLAKSINGLVLNGMEEENTPTKTFIRVAVPENICLQCGKLIENPALRRKLFSGKQKTKTCQSLELLLGDVFPRDNDLGTICRNCPERNETLTKKIFQVRANKSIAHHFAMQ